MLVACKNMQVIDHVKKEMNNIFEMKDLGPTKRMLGMEITRDQARLKKKLDIWQNKIFGPF